MTIMEVIILHMVIKMFYVFFYRCQQQKAALAAQDPWICYCAKNITLVPVKWSWTDPLKSEDAGKRRLWREHTGWKRWGDVDRVMVKQLNRNLSPGLLTFNPRASDFDFPLLVFTTSLSSALIIICHRSGHVYTRNFGSIWLTGHTRKQQTEFSLGTDMLPDK